MFWHCISEFSKLHSFHYEKRNNIISLLLIPLNICLFTIQFSSSFTWYHLIASSRTSVCEKLSNTVLKYSKFLLLQKYKWNECFTFLTKKAMFSKWTKTNKTTARIRSTRASKVTWVCKTHWLLTGGPQITKTQNYEYILFELNCLY